MLAIRSLVGTGADLAFQILLDKNSFMGVSLHDRARGVSSWPPADSSQGNSTKATSGINGANTQVGFSFRTFVLQIADSDQAQAVSIGIDPHVFTSASADCFSQDLGIPDTAAKL